MLLDVNDIITDEWLTASTVMIAP